MTQKDIDGEEIPLYCGGHQTCGVCLAFAAPPGAVDADYSFASYHSKTVVKGNVVDYTRTFEVKELSVPVNKAEDLREFYRIIAGDERNTMVLKPVP